MEIIINVALTVVGLTMLCYGGKWLVNGGVSISRYMGISSMMIGMTVVAYGTSTPELAASIAAAGEHSQIILGNVVGSNIANVGMVIGVSATLVPLLVKTPIRKELIMMIGASVLLIILSLDGQISQYDGLALLIILVAFTIYTYRSAGRHRDQDVAKRRTGKFSWKPVGFMGAGIVLLYVGAELTVDNAVKIAESFGIPEKIIGVTVIAIGTSLPELITSVVAIKKGHTDIGIGNIIGSNIYNILMIMGIVSAFAGVAVTDTIYADYAIMMAFSLFLFVIIKTGAIRRIMGVGLAAGYAAYIIASLVFL